MKDIQFIRGRRYDSNSVVVLGKEPFIVDTGTGMLFPQLASQLKNTEMDVVNTHCHFDHVGGNHYFKGKVFAHPLDAEHIRKADEYTQKQMFGMELEPQEVQELGKEFRGWEVIHTPGHTQGSICLFKDGVLISGDTLFADGHGRTDLIGGDEKQMQATLEKLEALDYEVLLPGHGERI